MGRTRGQMLETLEEITDNLTSLPCATNARNQAMLKEIVELEPDNAIGVGARSTESRIALNQHHNTQTTTGMDKVCLIEEMVEMETSLVILHISLLRMEGSLSCKKMKQMGTMMS